MNKNVRLGLVLPLVAVTVAWLAMMVATYVQTHLNDFAAYPSVPAEVKASTYIVLVGLALASGLVLWGFRKADAEHWTSSSNLVRSVYRFGGLMVVLALVGDALFAIVTFLTSLATSSYPPRSASLEGRIFGTYVPIILDAALVVFVLLQATMYRKSQGEEAASAGVSDTKKALAFGYALPVLGAALAIIIGLSVYDFQRNQVQSWTWVVIFLILGASVVLGTRFAAKAKQAVPVVAPPKVVGAAGAVRLNYVLSVVFAGVVGVMSFTFGLSAVTSLSGYTECVDGNCSTVNAGADFKWWSEQMIPALVLLLLVQAAVYFSITLRNKEVTAAA